MGKLDTEKSTTAHQADVLPSSASPHVGGPSKGMERTQIILGFTLCCLYIVTSSTMIRFNKYLMAPGVFPYAMPLTAFHMVSSSVLAWGLYFVRPQFFPAMPSTKGKETTLLKWFIPLGILFCIYLFFSNQAYFYCNVAFLQFMKEGNIVLIFTFSCLVGLQVCTRARLCVLLFIAAGASLAVKGEIHFVWYGFALQLTSQVGDVGRSLVGEYIMGKNCLKLDPLTFVAYMAPVATVLLSIGCALTWESAIVEHASGIWPTLLANALLAFLLNVTMAATIRECSALAFVLAGLIKDMFLVSISALMFGELVSYQQMFGFSICIVGICFWSWMRISPESPIVVRFEFLTGTRSKLTEANEHNPLFGSEKKV